MLSISSVGGASGAANYYSDKDNYYFLGEQSTEWFGKGAEQLGLAGAVDKKIFESVLEGKLPDGGDLTFIKGGENKHQAGYDLTFSAPKSVSVLALIEGDKEVLAAHKSAVQKTLAEIESFVTTRSMIDGVPINSNTSNLVAALFMHDTSRNLDPQLHTHAIIANATFNAEKGQWATLSSDRYNHSNEFIRSDSFTNTVFGNKLAFGAIYRQYLKEDLSKQGYEFTDLGKGLWEIKGVPTEIFSSRRQEILDSVEPNASAKSLSVAAKDTRQAKDFSNIEAVKQEWKQKLAETGFNKADILKENTQEMKSPEPLPGSSKAESLSLKEEAKLAVDAALEKLSKNNVKFGASALLTEATYLVKAQDGIVIAIRDQINSLVKSGALIATDKHETTFTTREHLQNEGAVASYLAKLSHQQKKLHTDGDSVVQSQLANQSSNLHIFNLKGGEVFEIKVINDVQRIAEENKSANLIVVPNKNAKFEFLKQNNYQGDVYTMKEYLNSDVGKNSIVTLYRSEKMPLTQMKEILQKSYLDESKVVMLDTGGKKNTGLTRDIALASGLDEIKLSATEASKRVVIFEGIDRNERLNEAVKLYTTLAFNGKDSIVQAKKRDMPQLNEQIRTALSEAGLLSTKSTHIQSRTNIYVEDYSDRRNYKAGYTLEKTVKGKIESYTIQSVNDKTNKIGLINQATGEVSSLSISRLNGSYRLYKDVADVEISVGDKLRSTGAFRDIKPNQHFSVVDIKSGNFLFREKLILEDQHGNQFSVPTNKLTKLEYDYVESIGQGKSKHGNVIALLNQSETNSATVTEIKRNATENVLVLTASTKEEVEKRVQLNDAVVTVTNSLNFNLGVDSLKGIVEKSMQNAASNFERLVDLHIEKATHQDKNKMAFSGLNVAQSVIGMAQEYKINDVRQVLFDKLQQGEIIPLDNKNNQVESVERLNLSGQFVTKENVELEQKLLNLAQEGKGKFEPILSDLSGVNLSNLTKGQQQSAEMILTSKDGLMVVQGYAGVGKTRQLSVIIDSVLKHRPDIEIQGAAPTHSAVSELSAVGLNSSTIAEFLKNHSGDSMPKMGEFANKLFVIDESSMIGNRDMVNLLGAILGGGGRVVLSGDHAQLKAFDSGSPLRLLYERGVQDTSTMTEIVRQKESLRSAVDFAIRGAVPRSLAVILRHDPMSVERSMPHLAPEESIVDLSSIENQSERYQMVAADFISRTTKEQENTVVITPRNNDKRAINEAIHAARHDAGLIGREELKITVLDRVNSSQVDIRNPSFWKENIGNVVKRGEHYYDIASVNERVVTIKDGEGSERHLDTFSVNHKTTAIFQKADITVSEGDRIRITATDKERAVKNNASGIIEKIEGDKITARIDDKIVQLNPNTEMLDKHIDLAYAGTDYALQGGSFSNAIMFVNSSTQAVLDSFYVQVSRAKNHVQAYIDNVAEYAERAMINTGERLTATEMLERKELTDNQKNELQAVLQERNSWSKGRELSTLRTHVEMPEKVNENARFIPENSEIIFKVLSDNGSHRGNYHVPFNPYRGEMDLDNAYYQGGSDGSIIVLNQGDDKENPEIHPLSELGQVLETDQGEKTIIIQLNDKQESMEEILSGIHPDSDSEQLIKMGGEELSNEEKALTQYLAEIENQNNIEEKIAEDQPKNDLTKLGNDEVNIIYHQPKEQEQYIDKDVKEKTLE